MLHGCSFLCRDMKGEGGTNERKVCKEDYGDGREG